MVRHLLLMLVLSLSLAACATSPSAGRQQPVNWAKPWMPDFSANEVEDHAQVTTTFDVDALNSDDDRRCTLKEQIDADAIAGLLDTPQELISFFDRFGHCDDGSIAEEVSESVTELLNEHWEQVVVVLAAYAQRDPTFGGFVANHVDGTVPEERVVRIRENARRRCPQKAKELCELILGEPPR